MDTDVVGCQAALYEWAESFDSKDWDRLSRCIAPSLYVTTHFAGMVQDISSC